MFRTLSHQAFGMFRSATGGRSAQRAFSSAGTGGGTTPAHGASNAHSASTIERWRLLSAVGAVPVFLYGVWLFWEPHPHAEPPPAYPYLRRRARDPAFPWGNHELLGAPWDREPHTHADAE